MKVVLGAARDCVGGALFFISLVDGDLLEQAITASTWGERALRRWSRER
jgi:hypothetical protein